MSAQLKGFGSSAIKSKAHIKPSSQHNTNSPSFAEGIQHDLSILNLPQMSRWSKKLHKLHNKLADKKINKTINEGIISSQNNDTAVGLNNNCKGSGQVKRQMDNRQTSSKQVSSKIQDNNPNNNLSFMQKASHIPPVIAVGSSSVLNFWQKNKNFSQNKNKQFSNINRSPCKQSPGKGQQASTSLKSSSPNKIFNINFTNDHVNKNRPNTYSSSNRIQKNQSPLKNLGKVDDTQIKAGKNFHNMEKAKNWSSNSDKIGLPGNTPSTESQDKQEIQENQSIKKHYKSTSDGNVKTGIEIIGKDIQSRNHQKSQKGCQSGASTVASNDGENEGDIQENDLLEESKQFKKLMDPYEPSPSKKLKVSKPQLDLIKDHKNPEITKRMPSEKDTEKSEKNNKSILIETELSNENLNKNTIPTEKGQKETAEIIIIDDDIAAIDRQGSCGKLYESTIKTTKQADVDNITLAKRLVKQRMGRLVAETENTLINSPSCIFSIRCFLKHQFSFSFLELTQGSWCKFCNELLRDAKLFAEENGGKLISKTMNRLLKFQCSKEHQWQSSHKKYQRKWCGQCISRSKVQEGQKSKADLKHAIQRQAQILESEYKKTQEIIYKQAKQAAMEDINRMNQHNDHQQEQHETNKIHKAAELVDQQVSKLAKNKTQEYLDDRKKKEEEVKKDQQEQAQSNSCSFNEQNPSEDQLIQMFKVLLFPDDILQLYFQTMEESLLTSHYRNIAKLIHPDKNSHNSAAAAFQKLNHFYSIAQKKKDINP